MRDDGRRSDRTAQQISGMSGGMSDMRGQWQQILEGEGGQSDCSASINA